MKEKEIFVYHASPRMHSHAKMMINNPPKGYKFVLNANKNKMSMLDFLMGSKVIKAIYRTFIKKLVNPLKLYNRVYSSEIPESADLVFSESVAIDIEKPWVVQILDAVYALAGNDYNVFVKNKADIERKLSSKNCKRIIVVNESTIKGMRNYFGSNVMKKTVLIRAAVDKQKIKRDYNRKKLQVLFMGSVANPDDFIMKGGLEALETFKKISEEFDNVNFIVRCKVPEDIREKYKDVRNLRIIDNNSDFKQIRQLYINSDILLNPAHVYPLMTTLEALSFGIPIVMLDTYGVRDYLDDGKNALLVKPSDKITGYHEKAYPSNIRSPKFISEIKDIDNEVVERLCRAIRKLILDKKLREKLGKNGKRTAEKKFSLELRNKKLKKVFDDALNR